MSDFLRVACELESVHGDEVGVALLEGVGIHEELDAVGGRHPEVVLAVSADPVALGQLDVVNDLGTVGTFVPEPLGHISLLGPGEAERGFLEDGHGEGVEGGSLAACESDHNHLLRAGGAEDAGAFVGGGTRGKDIIDEDHGLVAPLWNRRRPDGKGAA